MTFKTEFELSPEDSKHPEKDYFIERKQEFRTNELGEEIAKSFGWNYTGQTSLLIQSPVIEKWSLEIEAFPMDEWMEFKGKLFEYLQYCEKAAEVPEILTIIKLIQELESFSKPSMPML